MAEKMISFKEWEIGKVLKGKRPYADIYRMKIKSDDEETKWLRVTRSDIKKIRKMVE